MRSFIISNDEITRSITKTHPRNYHSLNVPDKDDKSERGGPPVGSEECGCGTAGPTAFVLSPFVLLILALKHSLNQLLRSSISVLRSSNVKKFIDIKS